MVIWGCLLVGMVMGSPLRFQAEYSAWSGTVTKIRIGPQKQEVKVAIILSQSFSILWTPVSCPAFIDSECVNSPEVSPVGATSWYSPETFQFIGDEPVRERFLFLQATMHATNEFLRGRDVAGLIGAGKESVLFQNKIIEFRESDGKLRVTEIPSALTVWFARRVHNLHGDSWRFLAYMANRLWEFEFDLSADLTIIPSKHLMDMLSNSNPPLARLDSRINPAGRVYLKCSLVVSRPRIDMSIVGASENAYFPIRLSWGLSKHSPKDDWCPSRFLIRGNVQRPIIGRALMQHVKSVVLDYRNGGRIGFTRSMKAWTNMNIFPEYSEPRIPVFTDPHVLEDRIVVRKSDIEAHARFDTFKHGWILTRESPRRMLIDDEIIDPEAETLCWAFLPLSGFTPFMSLTFDELPGLYDDMVMERGADGELVFRMVRTDDLARRVQGLVVRGLRNGLMVCKKIFHEYHRISLPREGGVSTDLSECSICLGVKESEASQGLHGCGHRFHQQCIKEWFRAGGESCPVCRTPVATEYISDTIEPLSS